MVFVARVTPPLPERAAVHAGCLNLAQPAEVLDSNCRQWIDDSSSRYLKGSSKGPAARIQAVRATPQRNPSSVSDSVVTPSHLL